MIFPPSICVGVIEVISTSMTRFSFSVVMLFNIMLAEVRMTM